MLSTASIFDGVKILPPKKGSIAFRVILTPENAEHLEAALDRNDLGEFGVTGVTFAHEKTHRQSTASEREAIVIDTTPEKERQLLSGPQNRAGEASLRAVRTHMISWAT